ncbi:MAG: TRAP transporter substrate-binding protein [Bradyrhizobium sp.]|nr:TRAP transporter substrate-binding protein [Bradyrhizobium sp.]
MSTRSALAALAATAVLGLAPLPVAAQTQGLPATSFNVVGSIGNLSMYLNRELPFWNETVPKESSGAIKAQVKSFTELGLKGPEIFRLVSSGTLQFATTVLNYNSGEVPMNEAADLVGLVGSVEELQKAVNVLRPSYAKFLEEKHGLKLLGFGSYQAQVIYCRDAFVNVADLKGRKVRASGASQQAFVSYIGGSPITIAFAEVQPALASGVIDCAITGALSGYRSKWHESAKFISPMPINFGLAAHLANLAWWKTLDPKVQNFLETHVRKLEDSIFDQAKTETQTGIDCNTGSAACKEGQSASMKLVAVTPADEALRKDALVKAIMPGFAQRCGAECVANWNATIGQSLGLKMGQ